MLKKLKKLIVFGASLGLVGVVFLLIMYAYMYMHLPDVNTLKNIQLQVPLKIYTADKKLIAQYGEKRRTPIAIEEVPRPLIDAILATEDQRYFEHPGVDFIGLVRACVAVISSGRKSQGASTITMQVARNFFLSRKKTYSRKVNEILLAIKIDATFSKRKILELYLNKIYLGHRAYGVAAAAQVYYGKQLNELTLAQLAMIAGLPQAPSRDNPISNPEAAKERRNHVLLRMLNNGTIDQKAYQEAIEAPVTALYHETPIDVYAPYIAEMVRATMVDAYGKEAYTGGYEVYTTLDSELQQSANDALQKGLEAYDQRHGYRGKIANWGRPEPDQLNDWQERLKELGNILNLQPAVVLNVDNDAALMLLQDGQQVTLTINSVKWARTRNENGYLGPHPTTITETLSVGDVVRVVQKSASEYQLSQVPDVEGALVAMRPQDGAIQALVGGYSYNKSNYNRVTQAKRQPGSAFKPFVYSAALAKGFTLATVINDAPIVTENTGSEDELWRPHNSNERFYGPTRLRTALVRSRNIVSIRLLREVGIEFALNYLHRFGFNSDSLPHTLTLALGSGALTPMELTTGFAVFANGGYKVKPYFISYVKQNDKTIYQEHPLSVCEDCATREQEPTDFIPALRVITPQNAYLITNAMQDVIQHGTGRGAKVLGRDDIAGKTGTTNNKVDAWFSGFTNDLVTTVWVGFDQPRSLHEYAAKTALPIWVDFMREALKRPNKVVLEQPANIINVKIDPRTGMLPAPGQKHVIFEKFRKEYAPTERSGVNKEQTKVEYDDPNSAESQLY